MRINTAGIVIKEQSIKEKDKLLTVLTSDIGKISVWANNIKSSKGKNLASSRLMAYSLLSLNFVNEYYYLTDSQVQNVFFELRKSIERLSLAQYFCEFCNAVTVDNHNSSKILSLLLNSLHMLCKDDADILIIKAAFELRLMSVSGFMPDVSSCYLCGESRGEMLFNIKEGRILHKECKNEDEFSYILNDAVLKALRYVISSDSKKIFSFKLDDDSKIYFSKIIESFCLFQLDYNFKALEFFKKLMSDGGKNGK